ncbi:MAG: phage portal protein [Thermoguttaceae bacterium]
MAWEPKSFIQEGLEKLRADYNAAKPSRFRRGRAGVGVIPRHADWHYRMEIEFFRMLELNRDFDRNDIVVGQAVQRLCDNVLQDGITPDACTPDKGLNRTLNARWQEEAGDEELWDLQGEEDFHGLESDVLHSTIVDGDICAVPRPKGQIELKEAHLLRTPQRTRRNIVHGVEIHPETRRRIRYWFCQEDVNPLAAIARVSDMEGIAARDREGFRQVFQTYFRKRASQTRGVSALAPVCDIAGMHDDLQFSALVKAQVASCYAIFREIAPAGPGMTGQQRGSTWQEPQMDGTTRTIEGIAPGMEIQGRPGEKLQGFSPNVPNPEFFPHSVLLLTFIACNLGLPIAVLLLDPRLAGNFSSLRGVWDQAKIGMKRLQRKLVRKFHRPAREFRLRFWATGKDGEARSLLRAWELHGRSFFACKWRPPRWAYIEPLTDAASAILRSRNLQQSPRQCAAEAGYDWDDLCEETMEDNGRAIYRAMKMAQKIRGKFPGESLDWREVLSLPTPDRVNVSLSSVVEAATKTDAENPESKTAPAPAPAKRGENVRS